MAFVKTKVEGYSLSVEYVDGIVRIKNNTALNNLLKDQSSGSLKPACITGSFLLLNDVF